MFQSNGVDIKLEDCFELFKFVDEDGSGSLSINEFKLFLKSEGANESKIDENTYSFFSVPKNYTTRARENAYIRDRWLGRFQWL